MGKVINLTEFRCKTRKDYLAKNGARLDAFIHRWVKQNIDVDFRQLAEDFQQGQSGGDYTAWDYAEFRDLLTEALDQAFGETIYRLLRDQHWFDDRQISKDELIERCLSAYILAPFGQAHQT